MRKKKVCIVMSTHWSWVLGGAEYQVSLIMDRLVSNDRLDITFLTRKVDPSFLPDGYTIKKIKSSGFFARYTKAFDAKKLLSALEEIQPDIIYQRAGSAYTGICAWYAQKKNIPMVWHISHDMDVDPKIGTQKPLFKLLEKKFLEYGIRHSSSIIAQTDQQAMSLAKHYDRNANHIIRNFHPTPDAPINKGKKIKIVWVANFKPMKQPELFVRLAKELEDIIDARFVMIGRINDKYSKLLEDINSIKSLDYLGEQSQDQVNTIFSESHLLINTSKLEGFSNTFIQAWMRKVPVLTLTVDPDNIIKKHKVGICAGSYEKLKDAIIDLVSSHKKRVDMGKNGKQYAYSNHSMKNVDQILEILAQLLSSKSSDL